MKLPDGNSRRAGLSGSTTSSGQLLSLSGSSFIHGNSFKNVDCGIEESYWSWGYLRKRYNEANLNDLYEYYNHQLKNETFKNFLGFQIVWSLLHLVSIVGYVQFAANDSERNINHWVPETMIHGISLVFSVLAFSTIFKKVTFQQLKNHNRRTRLAQSVCLVYVLVEALCDIGLSLYLSRMNDAIRQPQTAIHLLFIYIFLPISNMLVILGIGVLVTIMRLSILTSEDLATNLVYYICVNALGMFDVFVRDVTVRREFLDRHEAIKGNQMKKLAKNRQDLLLHSIFPEHISDRVRNLLQQDQVNRFKQLCDNSLVSLQPKPKDASFLDSNPICEQFLEKYDNVSILFADIVNFTELTTKLNENDLVKALDSLFGQFDSIAEACGCLRIKLLGDCYYCVSGISPSTPLHAKNCVLLAFSMIEIINSVKDEYEVDVAMRIGIHSGSVVSGLVGSHKWHFDIWSKDVLIANNMEKFGKPNMVHISDATKSFLGDEFQYSIAVNKNTDDMKSYFVKPSHHNKTDVLGILVNTRESFHEGYIGLGSSSGNSVPHSIANSTQNTPVVRRRFLNLESKQSEFLKLLCSVENELLDSVEHIQTDRTNLIACCGKRVQNTNKSQTPVSNFDVNPTLLTFKRKDVEEEYRRQNDPIFKFSVSASAFVLLCIVILQFLTIERNELHIIIAALTLTSLCVLTLLSWVNFVWNKITDSRRNSSLTVRKPNNCMLKCVYNISKSIHLKWSLRLFLYVSILVILNIVPVLGTVNTYCASLIILTVFSFTEFHFLFKFSISIAIIVGSSLLINAEKGNDENSSGFTTVFGTGSKVYSHLIYLLEILFLLLVAERQMDYMKRLNFWWKRTLNEENKETCLTLDINNVLIHNILPKEIARLYLDPENIGKGHAKQYQNVTVLFATIPDFMEAFSVDDQDKCLKILNDVISDFDKTLLEYPELEKIKLVGSTYMAACGLRSISKSSVLSRSSLRYSNMDPVDIFNCTNGKNSLILMLDYAWEIMNCLQKGNNESQRNLQLRVGISCGPVVAGVIGAHKPHYDIWGNTVNVASRMDSTGVPGKIQITEESAEFLQKLKIPCTKRGSVNVKGKGVLVTYFVNPA